ncbi:MAG: hypothetical protein Q8885_01585 [Candidatus Phytoplasma stylosanthis]|nr:hypothetical protein [Candidatus Phytoplasma stylosanthis]
MKKSFKKKKRMIINFILFSLILLFLIWIIKKVVKSNNYQTPFGLYPKTEVEEEYFIKEGNYEKKYPINKISFHQPYRNKKGQWILDNVDKIKHLIKVKYTFFGLNGLENCLYPNKVPKDLENFVKNNPFSEWHSENDKFLVDIGNKEKNEGFYQIPSVLYFDKNGSLFTKNNLSRSLTILASIGEIKNDNVIYLYYEGPKYVIDIDEDFYLCEIPIPFINIKEGYYTKKYFLHFNPVKKYLTLYIEPIRNKK